MYLNLSMIYLCVSGYDYILLLFVGGSSKAHFLPGFLILFLNLYQGRPELLNISPQKLIVKVQLAQSSQRVCNEPLLRSTLVQESLQFCSTTSLFCGEYKIINTCCLGQVTWNTGQNPWFLRDAMLVILLAKFGSQFCVLGLFLMTVHPLGIYVIGCN